MAGRRPEGARQAEQEAGEAGRRRRTRGRRKRRRTRRGRRRPCGFSTPAGQLYYGTLLRIPGHERREFFNRIAGRVAAALALWAAAVGWAYLGLPGAAAGLALGYVYAAAWLRRGRYSRPGVPGRRPQPGRHTSTRRRRGGKEDHL